MDWSTTDALLLTKTSKQQTSLSSLLVASVNLAINICAWPVAVAFAWTATMVERWVPD